VENAKALSLELDEGDYAAIDQALNDPENSKIEGCSVRGRAKIYTNSLGAMLDND
jgi:hypothetical protein